MGYTATWAGLVAAPSGAVAVVLTPLVARFSGKLDARLLATISFAAFTVSYFMRAGYTTNAGFWDLTMPLLVNGVAMSTFFVRSEEHTSELQSLMRISYAVFCLKKQT